MNNAIGWFEIYVDNMPRAKAFYEAVFDIELSVIDMSHMEGMGMEMLGFPSDMGAYGASGALVQMPGVTAGVGGTLVYFACDDCAIEQARVEAAGGKVEHEKFPIGEHGFISMVYDTEGNMIGLHSMA